MSIEDRIIKNEKNEKVFEFLGIDSSEKIKVYFKPTDHYFFHEGLNDLWDIFGKNIPDNNKLAINDHGTLLNFDSGEIYAFVFGRYSFGIKCDFNTMNIKNTDELRIRKSVQGIEEDIRILGNEWALRFNVLNYQDAVFFNSYKKYGS